MDKQDVFMWLEQRQGELENRAVLVLACRELHEVYGYSLREVGEVFGVSYEWVRRALMSQSP